MGIAGDSATWEGRAVRGRQGTHSTRAGGGSICSGGQKGQSVVQPLFLPTPLQDRTEQGAPGSPSPPCWPGLGSGLTDSSFPPPLLAAAALLWGGPAALTGNLGCTPPLAPPSAGRARTGGEGGTNCTAEGRVVGGSRPLQGTGLWEVRKGAGFFCRPSPLDQTWLPASSSASLLPSVEAPRAGTPTAEPYPPNLQGL